jgi:chlorite dismutase
MQGVVRAYNRPKKGLIDMSDTVTTQSQTARPPQTTNGPRQFVNFAYYKLDPAFRRLPAEAKSAARDELLASLATLPQGMLCLSYSCVGLRGDVDFMLWRIAYSSDDLQEQTAKLNRTVLGSYLSTPYSFLSMGKRSVYIDKIDPGHTQSRARIVPGRGRYIFVYPFIKTREWYLLPLEQRQAMMDEHILVGNKYPSVKLNTTYSFGLDDQDFVVAFETDEPKDFLDLVMELRETQASRYTVRDTPIFSCVRAPIEQILGQLF